MLQTHYFLYLCLLASVFLSACAGSKSQPTRYYLIDPVPVSNSVTAATPGLRIEIVDLHIPQYLERFHIATRTSESRLRFSETHQWGENLRKNLLRTLSRNLSQLLATNDVGTPLNRSASRPDYRLQVYIEQFELDKDGSVRLIARWQLSDPEQQAPLDIFSARLQSEQVIADNDYDAIVASMRRLYGQLSEQIAGTIAEQKN